jgi:hypothetical protein
MIDSFENATEKDIEADVKFIEECTMLLVESLETNNM